MNSPATRDQILELLAGGKLTADQAERLLRDLEAKSARPSRWSWVLNPFARLSTGMALLVSAATAAAQLVLYFGGVRFDGAFDSHAAGDIGFGVALLDLLVSWPLVALVAWIASRAAARQGRVVDFLGAVGISRVPQVITGAILATLLHTFPIYPVGPKAAPGLAILAITTVPLIVWFFVLLFQGFRTASGLRGARCAVVFVLMLIAAEVLSKLALSAVG